MEKVVIGMSGGVDSSVAAWLLKKQGYDVIGVTMETWDDPKSNDGDKDSLTTSIAEDARKVADVIGIPLHVVDFRKEFKKHVRDYFVDEYLHGRTPNPCVVCNRYVKWEALLTWARELGADYVATGHYARILQLPNGRYTVQNSVTAAKDQTYALYNLTQEQLAHTMMPVGSYEKSEIRRMAEEAGLPVANKPDSQEICFIPDHDYAAYIRDNSDFVPGRGNFVDLQGNILGQHQGITHYTVGQRKGLGITFGKPMFVVEIRPDTNEIVLGDSTEVFSEHLICDRINWMSIPQPEAELRVKAKIRYSHKGEYCRLRPLGDGRAECIFEAPVRAVTPGQAVVFYEDDHVLGGATIIAR